MSLSVTKAPATRRYGSEKERAEEQESSLVQVKGVIRFSGGIGGSQQASIQPGTKRPRLFGEGRYCQDEDCDSRLSIYNRGPNCYPHSPLRYPRVRGSYNLPAN